VVELATVETDEFPLRVKLSWRDGNGHRKHLVPLRRGQTSM
jgi:hypothetical protein